MKACGVSVDSAALKTFMARVEGQQLHELINAGSSQLAKMPAVSGGAAAAPSGGAAAADAAPAEEKKEEAEDVDMGGLFGGDDEDYWTTKLVYTK